jgi:hypothetical protein
MAAPIFRTVKDAQDYKNQEIARSKTAISRAESKLNDEVRKPFALFIQDNPTSLLQTEEDYNQFKSTYDDRSPLGEDYLTVYGREKGIVNGFNVTKIAPAWLGSSLDEVREFDPKTLKYNPEALDGAGGIEMQLRVADKKNNRSFTAPITTAGKKVAELFGFGGKEAVEENTVKAFPETILNDMYDAFKEGIGIELLDPGIERLQRPSYVEARNLSFFDLNPEARGQREDYLFNLAGGLESSLAGSDTEPTEGDTGTTAQTATSAVSVLSPETTNYAKTNILSFTSALPRREDLPEELQNYIYTGNGTPFGINEEEYNSDQYSRVERKKYKKLAEDITNRNIREGIGLTLDPFFGPIDDTIAKFSGRSVEDLQTRDEVKKLYGKRGILNPDVLSDAFKADPQKFTEFQNDPIAFANKYKNDIKSLSGSPFTTKAATEVTKDSPFKISKEELNSLQEARKEGNLTAYTEILNRIAGNTDISDAQQQKVVNFLGQANNFIRVKNDSQSRAAQNIVLDMWAAMTREQRASYGGALLRFAQTGYLTFEGVEQQRKIQKDIEDSRTEDKLSKQGQDLLDLIPTFSSSDYEFEARNAEEIASLGNQITGQKDYQAFLDTAGIFLKRAIEAKGQPGLLDRFLSFGTVKGPADSGFTLGPNIIGVDENENYTDDPGAVEKFVVISPGGRDERVEIPKNVLVDALGPQGIALLMGVSAQNAIRNPNLKEGGG